MLGWRRRLKELDGFLQSARTGVLEVKVDDHRRLLQSIAQRRDYAELLALAESWNWMPAADVLGRLRAQMEFLARKLGKPVNVVVNDNGIRLPPGYLEKVWPTLVHVARNAVDHGIEAESTRAALGKPAAARLSLTAAQTEHEFLLEVADDGPGIDRAALQRRAQERGIEQLPDQPVELLIFQDGLSTRDQVTELSGRGVGLSATRAACLAAGGRIEVHSTPGTGTALRFRFPRWGEKAAAQPASSTRGPLVRASVAEPLPRAL